MKKIFSVLAAALILTLCVLPCFVSAAGEPTFEVSSAQVSAGGDVDVKIDIKNSPGITSAKLNVTFDSALTLKKVTYGKNEGLTQAPQELKSPVVLNWINGKSDIKGDVEYAVLTFTTDNVASGKYNISVSYDPEDVYNLKEENIKFNTVAGIVTVTGGDDSAAITNSDPAAEVTTIGATGQDDGNGNYIGEEETFGDDDYDEVATNEEPSKKQIVFWVCIALAVIIIAAVTAVIIKKNRTQKQD